MYKIGEIWADDNGCGIGALIIFAVIVGVIALPIMAVIWLWNAGSNAVNYGTADTYTAHARATATSIATQNGSLLQDPSESFSKLNAEFLRGEQPGQCFMRVTNTDTLQHKLSGYVDFEYVTIEAGMYSESRDSSTRYNLNALGITTINSGEVVTLKRLNGGLGILPDFPVPKHRLLFIKMKRVVLRLDDPGTESIPLVVKMKIFTSSVCDYKE